MSADLPAGMDYVPADLDSEGIFRSEPMQLIQFIIQAEAVHDTLDELGELGVVEFKDLNPGVNAFQRNFVNEVKRCDEMERKLRYLKEQLHRADNERLMATNANIGGNWRDRVGNMPPEDLDMDDLESQLETYEAEVREMNTNREKLRRQQTAAEETRFVLQRAAQFFNEAYHDQQEHDAAAASVYGTGSNEGTELSQLDRPLLADEEAPETEATGVGAVGFGFVTGVIERKRMQVFERVLWRATRGNLFVKTAEIEEPSFDSATGNEVYKNVFMIFSQGERLQSKIRRICDSFSASVYDCPSSFEERQALVAETENQLDELNGVMMRTDESRDELFGQIAHGLKAWIIKVKKEKAIYHTMNMFNYDVTQKCLIGEGWVPLSQREQVTQAVRNGTQRSGGIVPSIMNPVVTDETPPTAFKPNKFTKAFQVIVDAYGVAGYREMNPTPFTCISFPFLFGIMFGDLGHGTLLLCVALYLVLNEKKLAKQKLGEMTGNLFTGRYVLVLMAIFSMYCGWLYNETFAIPIDWWGTNWKAGAEGQLATRIDPSRTYPFGVDPMWNGSVNELAYYNSLKMKVSIVFGVVQMVFGVILSANNAFNKKSALDFWTGFVPQFLFLNSLFGYLMILIFVKWCTPFPNTNLAPSLLQIFIAFAMSPGTVTEFTSLYPGQGPIGVVLLLTALVCVPWMLLVKPYYLKAQHQRRVAQGEDAGEFVFSQVMIYNFIHAVEFMLGCISHTASYLRLWALSLAHSELGKVFWFKVMAPFLSSASAVGIILGFFFFAMATIGVLLVMEAGSAFMHALRLHWVEFQSKFYHGDGHAFKPFTYTNIDSSLSLF